jgi:hypothetical protein
MSQEELPDLVGGTATVDPRVYECFVRLQRHYYWCLSPLVLEHVFAVLILIIPLFANIYDRTYASALATWLRVCKYNYNTTTTVSYAFTRSDQANKEVTPFKPLPHEYSSLSFLPWLAGSVLSGTNRKSLCPKVTKCLVQFLFVVGTSISTVVV